MQENEIFALRQIENVANFVYCKGNPAVVNDKEIEAIRHFSEDHQDIKLERTNINIQAKARSVDGPSYSMEGKILMIKNKAVKVNLPS